MIKALVDIKKGEEINLCYGTQISNQNWFYSWGFIYQPNNYDSILLVVDLDSKTTPGYNWKIKELGEGYRQQYY